MNSCFCLNRRELLKAATALGLLAVAGCAATPTDRLRARLPARDEFVVRSGYVLTMDGGLGDLPTGDVHVRHGQIMAVGKNLATDRGRHGKGIMDEIDACARWTPVDGVTIMPLVGVGRPRAGLRQALGAPPTRTIVRFSSASWSRATNSNRLFRHRVEIGVQKPRAPHSPWMPAQVLAKRHRRGHDE